MALPMALSSIMSKHGVGAATAAPPSDGDEMDKPEGDSEMDHCVDEVADAVVSGDKDAIVSALKDLIDCLKQDDMEQDQD